MGRPPKSLLKDSHPDLAKELVDKSLLDTLSTGADKLVEWECEKGHRYFARPYNRTGKGHTGCPYCNSKKLLVGFNDLATTRPDLVKYLVDPSIATQIMKTSSVKVRVRCEKGHERTMPLRNLANQGISCPYCSGRYAVSGENDLQTQYPELAAELVDQSLASVLRPGSSRRVEWQCSTCGYRWFAVVCGRVANHYGCPACSGRDIVEGRNDLATVAPEYAATLVDPAVGKTIGKSSEVEVEWRCPNGFSHTWFSTPGNRMASPVTSGCPICANRRILPGFNDLATTDPELASELVDQSLATKISRGSGRKVEWRCARGHVWTAVVGHRTGKNPTGCPICNPTGTSRAERELSACVKRLLPDEVVLTNDQSLLPGRMELDIVVPSRKVAFEFNGVRWHSEEMGRGRSYHLDKARACQEAGYQLISIWEDDWESRRDVAVRLVAAKLGVTASLPTAFPEIDARCSERVFARKLSACLIGSKDARRFLDANHIQGKVTASRHFALVEPNGFVRAVMSVRSPRNNARMRRGVGEWEIQRYATCGTVVGGFSKLMRYAERVFFGEGIRLDSWVSLSSNDVSDGHLYQTCGFVRDGDVSPNYSYVGQSIGWYRHPKEKFQKRRFRDDPDLLWEDGWTETEAAKANELFRVWDAGKVRWVKSVSTSSGVKGAFLDVPAMVIPRAEVHIEAERITYTPSVMFGKPVFDGVRSEADVVESSVEKVTPSGDDELITVEDSVLRHGVARLSLGGMAAEPSRDFSGGMSDELVAQLVDKSCANLAAHSHRKVEWQCEHGHRWFAEVAARTSGSGCPYCSGRLPIVGENDLGTLRPDLVAQLVRPDEARTVGIGSSKKLEWRCTENPDHTWFAPVRNRVGFGGKMPTGCPHCSKHASRAGAKRRPTLAEEKNPILSEALDAGPVGELTGGSGVVCKWVCLNHDEPYVYSMSVRDRVLKGRGCPLCSKRKGRRDVVASSEVVDAGKDADAVGQVISAVDSKAPDAPVVQYDSEGARRLVEAFGDSDVTACQDLGEGWYHLVSQDMYVAFLTGASHGWHWLGEVDGETLTPSVRAQMELDVRSRDVVRERGASLVTFWDERLWDMDLWEAMGRPVANDCERSYSWLSVRPLHPIVFSQGWARPSMLSVVAKHYQHGVFFARELALWSDDTFLVRRNDRRRLVGAFFANRYHYIGKVPDALTDAEVLRGLTIMGVVRGYSRYDSRPMDEFLSSHPDVQSVVDPCAGWGERALCAAMHGVTYEAVDVNGALMSGYDAMVRELGLSGVSVSYGDAAKHDFGKADAVITCPPYMDAEIYSGDGAENLSSADFASWWNEVCDRVCASGARYFCLTTNQACRGVFVDGVVSHDFVEVEAMPVGRGQASHFNRRGGNNSKREFEEFIVFERA